MTKVYTAQEMRDAILKLKAFAIYGNKKTLMIIEDMLRQAANSMDSEEKREKKYEYATILSNCAPSNIHDDMCECGYHHFRREVGEWEEVKND